MENNDDFTVKNIRMVLPSGKTLYPTSYEAKKGLGAVEHPNLDGVGTEKAIPPPSMRLGHKARP